MHTTTGPLPTVLLVASDPVTGSRLRRALGTDRGFRVVAGCSTIRDARLLATRYRPDVIVLDVDPARPVDVRSLAHDHGPALVVLADAAHPLPGVAAVLPRDGDLGRLPHVVRRAAAPRRSRPAGAPITSREAEVLERVVRGEPTRVIADGLGVSPSAVRFHVRSLFRKYDVTSRAQITDLVLGGVSA